MLAEMSANCFDVLVVRPNSDLKDPRAIEVPIKAESYL